MIKPAHPSENIPPNLVATIRGWAASADAQGSLYQGQLSIIYNQNWFNLFVPKALGGLELSLPEALVIEEALAWVDGSTGWTVTLCSGANWFAGFLPPETAKIIFSASKVCLAGSGQPSGIAKVTPEGYIITGRWKYATGAPHATSFTANCIVEKEGIPLIDGNGSPLVQSFIFLREEVTIHPDWHTTGMIATASHSFEVDNLHVPASRCFTIDAGQAVLQQAIYQYPFLQFAEATLSINAAGMAARFIQLAEIIITERANLKKINPQSTTIFLELLNSAKQRLEEARDNFYATVQASWEACVPNTPVEARLLTQVSKACHLLAETSVGLTDSLYPFCGLAAADTGTEINRVWRNMHTASQHTLLLPK